MHTDLRLLFCCMGNPDTHYCWKGVHHGLKARVTDYQAINIEQYVDDFISRALNSVSVRLSKPYYRSPYFDYKGIFKRRARAVQVFRKTFRSRFTHVLHLATWDAPLIRFRDRRKHFMLTDSVWSRWAQYCTTLDMYPAHLIRDIEQYDRKAYAQYTHIFTTGEHVREDLLNHYGINPDRVTAVGTGAGTTIKPYHGPKDYRQCKMLFVAKTRFSDKGRDLVVSAFRKAVEKDRSLHLYVVGDPKFKVESTPNLHVRGFVTPEELQGLFEEATLFLLPAVNEPWGLVYLEALGCRTPIVGLRRNAVPEFTQNDQFGFTLSSESSEELAALMLYAAAKPDLLEKMGREGQTFCLSKYRWDRMVDTILNVITSA